MAKNDSQSQVADQAQRDREEFSVDTQGKSLDEQATQAKADAQKGVGGVHSGVDGHPVSAADESSEAGPYHGKGAPKTFDPPLRSDRPGEAELAVSLATGAGLHTPPDPEKYDNLGNPR